MDLLQDAPITIVLSPDNRFRTRLPARAGSLRGDVFLADRGYLDRLGFFIFPVREVPVP